MIQQGCIKKLNEKLSSDESLKKEKQPNELLQMTSNINTLIKDIFRSPPIYKANITLSWKDTDTTSNKTVVKTTPETNGTSVNRQKRHTPITFDSDTSPNKISRGNGKPTSSEQQKIYTPPSGKYSTKVSGYGKLHFYNKGVSQVSYHFKMKQNHPNLSKKS